jgi:alanyl aminopeptidase
MEWWDDLWLNESFADWMGDKITQRVFPQDDIEVDELASISETMAGDARPSSQAVRQPVESIADLMQNVGTQYNKGKAVLAMFEQWIGEEKFRAGVLDYLEQHAWGNATAADLWRALSRASGNDVAAAMATFIERPGLPLVRVVPEAGNRVRLTQRRFSNWGVEQPDELWKVPVTLRYSDGKTVRAQSVLLDTPARVVSLEAQGALEWVLPNADQRGYFRWQTSPEMLQRLASRAGEILNERERVGFIGNLSALLDAGLVHGDEYLSDLGEFADDTEPMVLSALLTALDKVEVAFVPPELEDSFAHYVRRTLKPALGRFGLQPRPREEEGVAIVRPRLLEWLGDHGKDADILAHAGKLARAYTENPSSIDAGLAGVALQLAAIYGDRALFDLYRRRFETSQVPADRNRYLGALGRFREPQLVDEALGYTLGGPLRPNEIFRIPFGLMSSQHNRERVFAWFMQNYGAIAGRVPPPVLGFMPWIAGGCSAERLAAAEAFFAKPENQAPGTATTLAKVGDQVRDCVGLREREGAAVAAYLGRLLSTRSH